MSENVQEQDFSLDLGYLPDVRITLQIMGLHVRCVESQWKFPSHEHPMFEIHWIAAGELTMVVDGKIIVQHEGDVLFLRPGITHSCRSAASSGATYFSVHFTVDDGTYLTGLSRQSDPYFPASSQMVRSINPVLTTLYQLACEHGTKQLPISKHMSVYASLFELLGIIGEQLSLDVSTELSDIEVLAHKIAEQIHSSVRNVQLHDSRQHERVWIESIARSLRVSTSHVNRVFHRIYGTSPRQYMSELIYQEAKRLLIQSDLPIDRISVMLGYKAQAHFSRQFKRWSGLAPTQFRSHYVYNPER
jgi:AraC-like DNA-binding protein